MGIFDEAKQVLLKEAADQLRREEALKASQEQVARAIAGQLVRDLPNLTENKIEVVTQGNLITVTNNGEHIYVCCESSDEFRLKVDSGRGILKELSGSSVEIIYSKQQMARAVVTWIQRSAD
ncbi:hypothetical protein [Ancylobacter amanitiformis]|uniref:Uncharacterized protein n=1 Tax=Ancylobacter amanitiformis TaxID=217069 RepID=A0ABU0LU71_9HYPH|nr:hypothetical protein [Ancylobacter amanitiformis]MDQ0512246.1 hypothetical protein [Ancylobacter amanitiformis]